MEHKPSTGSASSAEQKENKPYPTHSRLLSSGAKKIFNTSSVLHPQQVYTARLKAAEQRATPAPPSSDEEDTDRTSASAPPEAAATPAPTSGGATATKPGEHLEPRPKATDVDHVRKYGTGTEEGQAPKADFTRH